MAKVSPENGSSTPRALGLNEAWLHYFTEMKNILICNHIGLFETDQPLSEDKVRQAFQVTAQRQEVMRMKIVQDKSVTENAFGYKFVPMKNPEQVDVRSTDPIQKDDWPILLNDISKINLDLENGPLWRGTLVPVIRTESDDSFYQYFIILTIHHSIVDGKSGFDFMYRQLFPVLAAVVNDHDTRDVLPEVPLVKSFEELVVGDKATFPFWMKALLNLIRWKNRTFGLGPFVELKYPDEPSRMETDDGSVPFAVPLLLSHDLTSAVIQSSKQHGVSVHSVLIVASSMALHGTYQDAKLKPPSTIKTGWPIDMRVHAGLTSPQPLSTYNASGESKIKVQADCSPGKFWGTCKTVFSGVKKGASIEKCLEMAGLVKYFVDLLKMHPLEKIMDEFSGGEHGAISNLGNCNNGPEPKIVEGKFKIQMIDYCRAINSMTMNNREPHFFHGVSTFNGRLSWTISMNTAMVSQRFAKAFLGRLEQTLEKFCKTS